MWRQRCSSIVLGEVEDDKRGCHRQGNDEGMAIGRVVHGYIVFESIPAR
jgi:hypothetical protein